MTDSYTYDAFGATKTHTGTSANVWKFTGEQNDVTVNQSPYFLRARYYDPVIGRFLTRDPFKGLVLSPDSLNAYAYADNDPAVVVDPWGLCSKWPPNNWGDCPQKAAEKVVSGAEKVAEGTKKAADVFLQTMAIPTYGIYYLSYEAAKGINYIGSQYGIPGEILSHLMVLPLVVPEAIGLAGDVLIDLIEGHTVKSETIWDEGKEGHVVPRFIRGLVPGLGPIPPGGPTTYLPGMHKYDHGIDFEW